MAITDAAAFQSYEAIGLREDLTDLIENISPMDCPAVDRWGSTKATHRKHEWQTDVLAAAAANAYVEGEAFAPTAITPTVRQYNDCQLMIKMFMVTDTENIINKAGRDTEVAYQRAKALKELKRDMEFAIFASANAAATTGISGAEAVAPKLRSVDAWQIKHVGATGQSGQATAATITEADFNGLLQTAWVFGARPNTVYCNGGTKRVFSAWGLGTNRPRDVGLGKKLVNVVDVYVSDFGELDILLDRYVASQAFYVLDDNLWKKASLVPTREKKIAETGLVQNYMVWNQWTIECRNASGNAMGFTAP